MNSEAVATTTKIFNPKGVMRLWLFRIRRMQEAHYREARRYSLLRWLLGGIVIALGAVGGGTAFAALRMSNEPWMQLVVCVVSILSAAFAGLQTFLNYPELAENHRAVGAKFANMKHKIELLAAQPLNEKQLLAELVKIEKQWAKIRDGSPNVGLWNRIESEMTFDKFEDDYAKAKIFCEPNA